MLKHYEQMDPVIMMIANKHRRIQMQCPQGIKLGESCRQNYYETEQHDAIDVNKIQLVYVVNLICTKHKENNISRTVSWFKESQRGKLGKTDTVFGCKFITPIAWKTKTWRGAREQRKRRMKFTQLGLNHFLSTTVNNC